jgi:hypothetical protein
VWGEAGGATDGENKLAARRKKAFRPRTTLPGQGAAPDLIKELEPNAPDQVWASDSRCPAGGLWVLIVGWIWGQDPFDPQVLSACDLL